MEINTDECEFDCDTISDLAYQKSKDFISPDPKLIDKISE